MDSHLEFLGWIKVALDVLFLIPKLFSKRCDFKNGAVHNEAWVNLIMW